MWLLIRVPLRVDPIRALREGLRISNCCWLAMGTLSMVARKPQTYRTSSISSIFLKAPFFWRSAGPRIARVFRTSLFVLMAAAETDCGSSQGSAVTRDPNKSGALAARFGAPGRTLTCGIRLRRRRKSAPTRHPDRRLPLNEPSEVGGPRPPRSASLLCLTSSTRRATPPRWPGRGAASPPVHRSAARSARDRNGWHVAAGEPDGRRQVGDGIQRDAT
jgi:hypothetical protein